MEQIFSFRVGDKAGPVPTVVQPGSFSIPNSQVLIPIYDELESFIFSENYLIHTILSPSCLAVK